MTKIIVYKQFTTIPQNDGIALRAVSSMTKIIVYKQFTTTFSTLKLKPCCFQYDKDNSL